MVVVFVSVMFVVVVVVVVGVVVGVWLPTMLLQFGMLSMVLLQLPFRCG